MAMATYIAETDENGHINCVWVIPPGKRSPQVYDPKKHRFNHEDKSKYCGAKSSVIQSWLAAQGDPSKR